MPMCVDACPRSALRSACAKWGPGGDCFALNEEQGAQQHFIELCAVLGVPSPSGGDDYVFEKGMLVLGQRRGGVDVFKRGDSFDLDESPDRQLRMSSPTIDLAPLRNALALLNEALVFWADQPEGAPLKPHLRSAVIQSFEFTYELSLRTMRRVLIERAASADRVAELSFNDLLRAAADAGLMPDATAWREWREMRNATSHAYDAVKAQAVASRAGAFATEAAALLRSLEARLAQ
jgi:nucleotidyltransferase substrate binding protein (TIGR01987 family)